MAIEKKTAAVLQSFSDFAALYDRRESRQASPLAWSQARWLCICVEMVRDEPEHVSPLPPVVSDA